MSIKEALTTANNVLYARAEAELYKKYLEAQAATQKQFENGF